ncbi:Helitron helicase [Heracleum sosnowskyi]|uniref:Helitron helicase n=1 Tax=Heracleum sosnowskyi TaxID=360622 RepID=A0AAD8IHQ3_9APIA|nr:Helitron helicase [Heracleum sosnowskyi]
MKLDAMMSDLTKENVLGRVLAVVYTIEFQKRGLPHAHIVLWLAEGDKLVSPEEIDSVVSAEIPDKETDRVAYDAVAQFMMHGPCGEANPKCPCETRGGQLSAAKSTLTLGMLYLTIADYL